MSERYILVNAKNSIITNSNSQYQLNFPATYNPQDEEIALLNCFIYYSWFNLSTAFNNLTCSYIFNTYTRSIIFPPGFYQVSDINNYIQLQMNINGDYLLDNNSNPVYYYSIATNPVYYSITLTATPIPTSLPTGWSNPHSITLSGLTPQLAFNTSNFNTILGFAQSTTYPPTQVSSVSQYNSTITPEVSPTYVVNISTNLSSTTRTFNNNTNIVYQFSPANSVFGSQIQIQPQNLSYYPIDNTEYNYMMVSFTNQNNAPLVINDNNVSLTFVIRKKKTSS